MKTPEEHLRNLTDKYRRRAKIPQKAIENVLKTLEAAQKTARLVEEKKKEG